MLHVKRILARAAKKWGYEYVLVAGGALLGLLIVLAVGIEDPPGPPPAPPENVVRKPTLAAPSPQPTAPVTATKRKELAPRATVARPADTPAAPTPARDLPAWRQFAAIHGPILGRPMVAVIIDDMGIDRNRSARAVRLPGPLTMSFLTYAPSLKSQASAARAAGHEIMIHVPMEADDSSAYAGPKAIRRDLPEAEVRRRVDWALNRLNHYVGINNHMGSGFTTHGKGMTLVLTEVGRRGLLFIDSRTSPDTVAASVARRLAVPFAARDFFLDDDPSRDAVTAKLKALEQAATAKGYAIAIGHPYDSTLSLLETWLPTLSSRGFVLVPVSAIVRHRQEKG